MPTGRQPRPWRKLLGACRAGTGRRASNRHASSRPPTKLKQAAKAGRCHMAWAAPHGTRCRHHPSNEAPGHVPAVGAPLSGSRPHVHRRQQHGRPLRGTSVHRRGGQGGAGEPQRPGPHEHHKQGRAERHRRRGPAPRNLGCPPSASPGSNPEGQQAIVYTDSLCSIHMIHFRHRTCC